MPTPPLRPAPERFASVLLCLGRAVAAQTGWGLSLHLIAVIVSRIQRVKHRFARLAARIAAGTYAPRRPAAAPEKPAAGQRRPPPPKNPLPSTPGWLLPLEASAAACRGQLEALFGDAEMVALMAAAPAAMARVLRPLCRMLALDLPPALATARAAPADPPPDPSQPAPAARPKAPPRRPPPSWTAPPPLPALTLEYVFGGGQRLVWN